MSTFVGKVIGGWEEHNNAGKILLPWDRSTTRLPLLIPLSREFSTESSTILTKLGKITIIISESIFWNFIKDLSII